MTLFGEAVSVQTGCFLAWAVLLALAFEFVSEFHDTATAVATVIYTTRFIPFWVKGAVALALDSAI